MEAPIPNSYIPFSSDKKMGINGNRHSISERDRARAREWLEGLAGDMYELEVQLAVRGITDYSRTEDITDPKTRTILEERNSINERLEELRDQAEVDENGQRLFDFRGGNEAPLNPYGIVSNNFCTHGEITFRKNESPYRELRETSRKLDHLWDNYDPDKDDHDRGRITLERQEARLKERLSVLEEQTKRYQ